MELGRFLKEAYARWEAVPTGRLGRDAIGLTLIRRGGEKALIDPPRSSKMTVIRRRTDVSAALVRRRDAIEEREEEGRSRPRCARLPARLRCPTPSGTIMPPYAEIRAARVTLHESIRIPLVSSVWRLARPHGALSNL